MEVFEKANCIWDFHIFQDKWTFILDERLVCKNEPGNPRVRYVVAVCKVGDEIMWDIFQELFQPCVWFLFSTVKLFTAQFQGDGSIQGIFHRVEWKFKKICWKLSRLEANLRKLQKFSTMNDLHYMVGRVLPVGYIHSFVWLYPIGVYWLSSTGYAVLHCF